MKLPKTYDPSEYEENIYALWERSQAFQADPTSKKEHFSISMPPPNETGTLSIGHSLFLTLQDIMARHARQQGKDVLWLPGTDHAALPVNAIIERKLAEEGTDKHQIGRDAFLKRTREFVSDSRGTMLGQMRAMGASADWTRLRYTLDDALSRCVNETFTKMYNDGLIYRGNRIVNWDPVLETNVSDIEVEYVEEQAKFYTFQYGPFQIGTARPETKFGDKYVVMHPDDERYAQYAHGQTFETEWINGPITATIIKDTAVDPQFGTGVMTITPWHSQVDFEIAERHGLDKEQIIDFKGNLLPIADEFSGMTIAEARPLIIKKLADKGLLVATDDNYQHSIAVNERGKAVIEPQIRLQWFVDVNKPVIDWKGKRRSITEVLQAVLADKDVVITPERFNKIYSHWVDNYRDWCISRQIWWGHRVPAWYRLDTDGRQETYVGVQPPTDQSDGWHEWQQDPDTLDTWFSSALWTWSTLIDPAQAQNYDLSFDQLLAKSPDFNAYHPTTVMETGWDILPFWVIRMILMTTYVTGQVPFKDVYLHGMVKAADGKKMSKSRPESIIDPLKVIPEYGTDALRMALVMGVSPGNDQNWSVGKIEANRNFCNKIWNIARFIEDLIGDDFVLAQPKPTSVADHWVLQKLQQTQNTVIADLDAYAFGEAYDKLYHFVWDDVADWYIEVSKTAPNKELLAFLLESVLTLLHPFAPFVTETIWQTLGWEADSLLANKTYGTIPKSNTKEAADFSEVQQIVTEIRFIQNALKVSDLTLYYTKADFVGSNAETIKRLARLRAVTEVTDGTGLHLTSTKARCWLDIDQATAQSYLVELEQKQTRQKAVITQLEQRLANKEYVKNAPHAVVSQTKQQLSDATELLASIEREHQRFSA